MLPLPDPSRESDDLAILDQALAWHAEGRGVAVATVVATWGSSPRPLGSQLAVESGGTFVGSVSGGCVEGAIVEAGRQAIADGEPRLLEFGVSDESAWAVGLPCGGNIRIHVEPWHSGTADALAAARRDGADVALVIDPAGGVRAVMRAGDASDEVGAMLTEGASGPLGELFVRVYASPWRLVVVGAVHVAQHLAAMAATCGFAVTVADPRTAFATADRFPGQRLVHEWADEFLAKEPLDARAAVVTLAHDPKIDDPALIAALRSPAFYVGALGSRRTHAKRVERLTGLGFTEADIARIAAPIGLDLGGRRPADIAVSILAQIIQRRNGKGG